MKHSPMIRSLFQVIAVCLLLVSTASPAMAAYKLLIKGPVCPGPAYCNTEFDLNGGSISISLPAYGTMPASTFTGPVSLVRVQSKLCKPGTNGNLEWLDQGKNVQGVQGSLKTPDGVYTMDLIFSQTNPVTNPTGPCTNYGQESFSYTRAYTITTGGRSGLTVIASGTDFVYNTNSIPEPETLLLLLAGFGSMGLVTIRRKRR